MFVNDERAAERLAVLLLRVVAWRFALLHGCLACTVLLCVLACFACLACGCSSTFKECI